MPRVLLIIVSILTLTILGVIAYGNSLNGGFLWDDDFLVKDNAYIKSFGHVREIFSSNIGSGAGRAFKPYRPLQIMSYTADYFLWGLDVKGYHVTNMLLHISAAIALLWLLNLLFQDMPLSLIACALFVTHPVHTEAVTYISGRADPLAALFLMLGLVCYIKYVDKPAASPLFFMALCYAMALLSRESAMIFPALAGLCHLASKRKMRAEPFIIMALLSAVFLFIRHEALRNIVFGEPAGGTFAERIPGFFAALAGYFRILIVPYGLHLGYGDKVFAVVSFRVLAGLSVFIILCGAWMKAWRSRGRERVVLFSLSWFFITLLPQSNLYPVSAYMAEHWLYLPSMGFFLVMAWGLVNLYRKNTVVCRASAAVIVSALVIYYASVTRKQNAYWNDPMAFYIATIRYEKDNPKLYNNLGKLYEERGDAAEAVRMYSRALAIKPDCIAYYNLGNAYMKGGFYRDAVSAYKASVGLRPGFSEAFFNMGAAYECLGEKDEAVWAYRKALEFNPRDTAARGKLTNMR
ncbi:MAG: tetratricopeptide repeat protein [Candidatus Omnitrophota bacterium]